SLGFCKVQKALLSCGARLALGKQLRIHFPRAPGMFAAAPENVHGSGKRYSFYLDTGITPILVLAILSHFGSCPMEDLAELLAHLLPIGVEEDCKPQMSFPGSLDGGEKKDMTEMLPKAEQLALL
ncbi:UNVERIFIED_CONTAM: hypothetical protein K2H54_003921, partial [Gekko kuhli]